MSELLIGWWHASPDDWDLLQTVTFDADGTGNLMSGGGQSISLDVAFTWTLAGEGRVRLAFAREARIPQTGYQPSVHEVGFRAEKGEFPLSVPDGTQIWRKRLVFDESPLPREAAVYHRGSLFFTKVNQIDPRGFLEFYGDPVRRWPWRALFLPPEPPWDEVLAGATHVSAVSFPANPPTYRIIARNRQGLGPLRAVLDRRDGMKVVEFRESRNWHLVAACTQVADGAFELRIGSAPSGRVQSGADGDALLDGAGAPLARWSDGAWREAGGAPLATLVDPFPGVRRLMFDLKAPHLLAPATWLLLLAGTFLTR